MIKTTRFFLLLVSIFFCSNSLFAQYFSSGQDPASINWKQINTNEFQIIFPEGYEKKAQYMAAVFQDLIDKGGKNLTHVPKKFSVVLHTHNATSNGMVAWAPKRMEVFTTSAQDNDAQLWIDHVATHEYRHVIQVDKLEQGFTRFLNFIFGQQATAVVVGMYLPPWFLEGDAVCAESALSESGRGRFPEFEQELRAQLLEKGAYSYDKAVNGSFKDFVTDRYKLGYYLVGKGRVNYGDYLWETTLNRVGQRPYGVTPFSRGLNEGMKLKRDELFENLSAKQKEILAKGIKVEPINWEQVKKLNTRADGKLLLYYDVMHELNWEWQVQDAQVQASNFESLTDRETVYTNKRYPHQLSNGDVLVYREGLADAGCFTRIKANGSEEKVFVPGYGLKTSFDEKKGILLWSERDSDIRWEKAETSVIVSYDLNTGERRKYKAKQHRFAPAFSPDGSKIVCVEVDHLGQNTLLVIDTQSGKEIKRYQAKEWEYFMTPQWDLDGKSIVMLLLNREGKHLVSLDLATGKKEVLFSSGKHEMAQPEVGEKYIYFTAAFTGIDNLFAYEKATGKIYQVSSSRFGARDPHHVNGKMYYSDYTSDGYLPVQVKLNQDKWTEWKGEFARFNLAEDLSEQVGVKMQADTTNLDRFKVKNYSRMAHLINVHSWAPVFIDGIDQQTDIGLSIASQNKLGTLLAVAGYKKEEGFDNGQLYANLSYRGWFPIIDSKLTVGDRKIEGGFLANRIDPPQVDTIFMRRTWRQWEWENSISFPFDVSEGKYSTKVIPKVTYSLVKYADINSLALGTTPNNPLGLGEYDLLQGDLTQEVMEYQLFAYNIAKMSPRDIQYQWAKIVEFNYRHTPFGDTKIGNTWSAEGTFYTPGFVKHHGMKFYGGYQNRSQYNSGFSTMIKSPRGVSDLYGEDVFTLGVDYALPLFYPDWNIGPLAYFKRVKMSAFFDYGYEEGKFKHDDQLYDYSFDYASFGAEFRTDMHALRFPAPVDWGFRVGYETQTENLFFDFLIGISLTSF